MEEQEQGQEKPKKSAMMRRKGIYILPNLFTLVGLFSGFYAIIAAMSHHFVASAIAVFMAMIFDSLDGRVARLINAQSAFGAELDSLSDMVCFGAAPALILYNFNLTYLNTMHWGKLGWLSSFLYVACVALRLARFNTQIEEDSPLSKRYFIGIPCPAAAGFIVAMVWVLSIYDLRGLAAAIITTILAIVCGLLMVSNIKFRSFKDIDLKVRVRFTSVVLMLIAIILVSWQPAQLLLAFFTVYVFSGPVSAGISWFKKRIAARKSN